jgi:hypothetical protein
LFGELEITGLPVSHTKDGFQWQGREEDFEERLRKILDSEPLPLLKQAEHYRARQASRVEQKRIVEATRNTADVAARGLPDALPSIINGHEAPAEPSQGATAARRPDYVEREFSFTHASRTWTFKLTASSRPEDARWLIRHVDIGVETGDVTCLITLNTAHPFLKQFALGTTDAIEAVFRLAVAMVVSETILTSAGDGEIAATFMRQVDGLLGSALSKRLGTDA